MYFVHVLWNKYFGNFQVLVLFAYNEYHTLMFAVWCVFGLFRNVSLFFLVCPWALFLYVFTSAGNLFFCIIRVSRCIFFFIIFISRVLYVYFCMCVGGGVRRGLSDKCAVLRACLFIHLQQLTDSYEFDLNFMLMKAA